MVPPYTFDGDLNINMDDQRGMLFLARTSEMKDGLLKVTGRPEDYLNWSQIWSTSVLFSPIFQPI